MNVTLGPEAESIVQQWLAGGRYPDAATVIEQALQALEEREHAKFARARDLVLAGRASGPGRELTDDVWAEMESAVDEAFARGDEPPAEALSYSRSASCAAKHLLQQDPIM